MARTYTQIQKQIEQLQKEAASLRQKEISGVVERIQDAIKHYGLTAQDLFGAATAAPAKSRRGRPAGAKSQTKAPAAKKAPNPPKYRDEAGNTWTGHGKRPRWFVDALAAGKTAAELEIKA